MSASCGKLVGKNVLKRLDVSETGTSSSETSSSETSSSETPHETSSSSSDVTRSDVEETMKHYSPNDMADALLGHDAYISYTMRKVILLQRDKTRIRQLQKIAYETGNDKLQRIVDDLFKEHKKRLRVQHQTDIHQKKNVKIWAQRAKEIEEQDRRWKMFHKMAQEINKTLLPESVTDALSENPDLLSHMITHPQHVSSGACSTVGDLISTILYEERMNNGSW